MKLIETPGNCRQLPLGKDVSLSLKQSLHVFSVPKEMGRLSCFLNYFFPKLLLFRQVKARRLPGECRSLLFTG